MSTRLMDMVVAKDTGNRKIEDPFFSWAAPLITVDEKLRKKTEAYTSFEILTEYSIHLQIGKMAFCKPKDLNSVIKNVKRAIHYAIYEDFRTALIDLHCAFGERDPQKMREAIDNMDELLCFRG